MKIIYMGTPEFAVKPLEYLYNAGYEISLVVTQVDRRRGRGKKYQGSPVKNRALELGLDVYQPENINNDESYKKLLEISPDFIIVAAYGQILKKPILEIPKYNCLNIHASLLPKYRGAAPINWAIMNNEEKTGITIMNMEEGLDTGGMILKVETPIMWEDDFQSVHDRLSLLGSEKIIEAIEMIVSGEAEIEVQKNEESSYAPVLYKGMGNIDWTKTTLEIYKKIMGLKPWPSAFTDYKDEKIKIHKVDIEIKEHDTKPGTVTEVDPDGVKVAVADGYIIIKELQFPGKRAMDVKDFLMGNTIDKGYIF